MELVECGKGLPAGWRSHSATPTARRGFPDAPLPSMVSPNPSPFAEPICDLRRLRMGSPFEDGLSERMPLRGVSLASVRLATACEPGIEASLERALAVATASLATAVFATTTVVTAVFRVLVVRVVVDAAASAGCEAAPVIRAETPAAEAATTEWTAYARGVFVPTEGPRDGLE